MRQATKAGMTANAAVLPGLVLAVAVILAGCSNTFTGTVPSNRYAIVIGVGTTASGQDCAYTDKDADSMAKMLSAHGWTVTKRLISDWPSGINNVIYASDGNPTVAAIREAILSLSTKVGTDKDATILVYYSGHGLEVSTTDYSPYNGALVPYDLSYDQNGYVDISSIIPVATLSQWLSTVDCRNKLLVLDSCLSGNFVMPGSAVDSSPSNYYASGKVSDSGLLLTALSNLNTLLAKSLSKDLDPAVMAISAAGAYESSYSSDASTDPLDLKQGVLTYYLLEAAAHGDANGDGLVTATEAFAYAKGKIMSEWNTSVSSSENFLPHISGGSGDLVLFCPAAN